FKDGLRVTSKEDMEVVQKVLCELNHEITADIKKLGGKAVSLNALNKGVIKARPHRESKQLGFVGEVEGIDFDIIRKAVRPRSVPVVSSVGIGPDSSYYNVNADEVSSEIAVAIKAVKLVLLTDVKGIMEKKGDLISTLTVGDTERLIGEDVIQTGMIPKVKACTKALKTGVSKTHIIDGRIPHSLLLEIFTDKGIGTEIIR
ncbi:MAG: acetylglutamate kinase, partial [Candidatus Omnitrophota bacterium]